MINGLDLFSGIGGIGFALRDYVRTIAYCENDRYAQGVLLSRMQSGDIDKAPIWDDVRTLNKKLLPEIDIIFGGFPCQDISVAGLGKGLEGERSGLFFEIIRLAKEIRPSFVFLENVPAIRTKGLEKVIEAFTEIRYDCRWTCISASDVGANHKRERWFLLAYTKCNGGGALSKIETFPKGESTQLQRKNREARSNNSSPRCRDVSDTDSKRLERQRSKPCGVKTKFKNFSNSSWWKTEPDVGRVVDGVPFRMDRIKCLGNSVVPLQVQEAFKKLIEVTK